MVSIICIIINCKNQSVCKFEDACKFDTDKETYSIIQWIEWKFTACYQIGGGY